MMHCDCCSYEGKAEKITGKKLKLQKVFVNEYEWQWLIDYIKPLVMRTINEKRDKRFTDRAWKGASEIINEMAYHGGGKKRSVILCEVCSGYLWELLRR